MDEFALFKKYKKRLEDRWEALGLPNKVGQKFIQDVAQLVALFKNQLNNSEAALKTTLLANRKLRRATCSS